MSNILLASDINNRQQNLLHYNHPLIQGMKTFECRSEKYLYLLSNLNDIIGFILTGENGCLHFNFFLQFRTYV